VGVAAEVRRPGRGDAQRVHQLLCGGVGSVITRNVLHFVSLFVCVHHLLCGDVGGASNNACER
jgi:hypothetical protein